MLTRLYLYENRSMIIDSCTDDRREGLWLATSKQKQNVLYMSGNGASPSNDVSALLM